MLSKEARDLIFENKKNYAENGGKPVPSATIEEIRERDERNSEAQARAYANTTVVREQWNIPVDVMTPKEKKRDDVFFFIHGGAWVFGSAMNARLTACYFTEEGGGVALCPEYRRAPEVKFSAMLDDCYRAYVQAANRYGADKLVLSGSSAGGNLALALMQKLRQTGTPYPKAIALFSPVALLDNAKESNECLGAWDIVLRDFDETAVKAYEDVENQMSPLYGDYDGFPPMYIACGSEERLLDDSVSLFKKAKKSGVKAVLSVRAGMWHSYLECQYFIPEGKEEFRNILSFIDDLDRGESVI
ncbi:MAG: alpha/beta hydrolase [Clostridia bacterium]|nr:alpha/beta hydrolase [Clostridia bacterium]